MDNLTHTLIGVTAAHSLPRKFRTPATYWALVIGNNLPDSDFIQSLWPGTSGLDYLVHHRGYTHSLFLAFLLAGVGAFAASRIARVKMNREVYGLTLLGCWMHVGADFMNNYGVHPFTPFSNRWYYGDTVFIVEPLLWFGLLPLAWFLARGRWSRWFWGLLSAVAAGLALTNSLVSLPVKGAVFLTATVSIFLHRRKIAHGRVGLAWILAVGSLFAFSSHLAKSHVRSELTSLLKPGESIRDVDATPSPGNPFCWHSWTVTDAANNFHFRSAALTLWPAVIPLESCGQNDRPPPTHAATVPAAKADENSRLRWMYESTLSRGQFDDLLSRSCRLQRLMAFVRFPFLQPESGGAWTAGDLRYDQRGSNFTAIQFTPSLTPETCEAGNSPWESPFSRPPSE